MDPTRAAHTNNFDAIRLIAALTVIVGHSWGLTGQGASPSLLGIPLFTLAVWVFFSLSGYLVATSWTRDPSILRFLTRRAGRIFPGLILVILLTAVVLGPSVTILSTSQYFASPITWQYLLNSTTVAFYQLPGVFENLPRPVVNGSLWTLGPEFCCYLVVAVVGGLTKRYVGSRTPIAQASIFAALASVLAAAILFTPGLLGIWEPAAHAAVFFMVGAIYANIVGAKPVSTYVAGLGLVGWLVVNVLIDGSAPFTAWIVLPISILVMGQKSTPILRGAGRFGDFSYGCYLWGYPVQQTIVFLMPSIPLWAHIAVAISVVVPIAFLSWRLVEKPVLKQVRQIGNREVRTIRPAVVARNG